MKQHKHNWQFVSTYLKQPFSFAYPDKRVASFICDCGLMKEVTIKLKKE